VTAESVIDKVKELISSEKISCFAEEDVTTEVYPSTQFFLAKLDDQKYFKKNSGAKCNALGSCDTKRFEWSDFEIKEHKKKEEEPEKPKENM